MANKFTSNITKNPNAIDPQGQKGFNKADFDKGQVNRMQEVQNKLKASQAQDQELAKQSNLKQAAAKLGGDTKTQGRSQEKAPTQDR